MGGALAKLGFAQYLGQLFCFGIPVGERAGTTCHCDEKKKSAAQLTAVDGLVVLLCVIARHCDEKKKSPAQLMPCRV